jgi:hypothetical protein
MGKPVVTATSRVDSYPSKRIAIMDKTVDEGGEGEGEVVREEAVRKNLTL